MKKEYLPAQDRKTRSTLMSWFEIITFVVRKGTKPCQNGCNGATQTQTWYCGTYDVINICDPSEQKQPFGCTLTNPPHVTPLRPGSTFIDGFSRAIYQKIADFNSYPLRYQYWKSVNNCGVGTQWRNVWWIRQGAPKRLLLLGGVTYIYIRYKMRGACVSFWINTPVPLHIEILN